jgi:hypothetical protein
MVPAGIPTWPLPPLAYGLELHRLALPANKQAPTMLEQAGDMYAWLQGNTLTLSGPTGYGFSIGGHWKQTIASSLGRSASNYSADGGLVLHTAVGDLPLNLPSGLVFSVTTRANVFGNVFGVVSGINWNAQLPLGALGSKIQQVFGINLTSISLGNKLTVELGSQIRHDHPDLTQVLDAVPYITYADKASFQAQFGNATITTGKQDNPVILADPADPFLYIADKGFAFAGSLNGRIPYTPNFTPRGPVSGFFGQVYAHGTFPLAGVPLSIQGDVTLNLDANGDGQWLGGKGNASQLFAGQLYNPAAIDAVLRDLDVGVNGEVDFAFSAAGFNVLVPLGMASAIYNGPQQGIWFKAVEGPTQDPFQGTVLDAFQATNTESVEGWALRNGNFSLTATDSYKVAGINAALTITLDPTGVTARGTANFLGNNVFLTGRIKANGDFLLAGQAGLSFGGFQGSGSFELSKTGSQEALTVNLMAQAGWSGGDERYGTAWSATATLSGSLTIVVDAQGHVQYLANLAIRGSLWQEVLGSASIGGSVTVQNHKLVIEVDGVGTWAFDLPV